MDENNDTQIANQNVPADPAAEAKDQAGNEGPGRDLTGGGTPTTPEPVSADERGNRLVIAFLGFALLGLVGGIVYMSASQSKGTLPDGLTSLASLIAGGLIAFLSPLGRRK